MNFSFLVTRPEHDTVVSYLSAWSKDFIKFARGKSIKFADFKGSKAVKKTVRNYLLSRKPKLVVFNGHGNEETICGHENEPLIANNENEHLLKSKIVYARSCSAAKLLGKNAVKKGCSAFIGYEAPFGFVRDVNREATPLKDRFAEPFKNVSNIIVFSLLKGNTPKGAVEKSKLLTLKLIKDYSTSDAEPGYKDVRFWLFWDSHFLKNLGDKNKTLF